MFIPYYSGGATWEQLNNSIRNGLIIDKVNVGIENMNLTRTVIKRNFAPQIIKQQTLTD